MNLDNRSIALAALSDHLDVCPLVFVIAQGDLVTVVARQTRRRSQGAEYDFFTFHTFEIIAGVIVARWANMPLGPLSSNGTSPGHLPATLPGPGDPNANAQKVADFCRVVFDGQNADAVAAFVTPNYHQHSSHLPAGRAGLERFVRKLFPDGPTETPETVGTRPTILMGEGDLVVIAAAAPEPDTAAGAARPLLYDGYRVRDGLLAEHWSGVDPHTSQEG